MVPSSLSRVLVLHIRRCCSLNTRKYLFGYKIVITLLTIVHKDNSDHITNGSEDNRRKSYDTYIYQNKTSDHPIQDCDRRSMLLET